MPPRLKTTAALLLSLFCATFLTSCGGKDTHAKLREDYLALVDKVVAICDEVSDKDSADAAAKKLEKLQGKFDKLAKRYDALGSPTAEELRETAKSVGSRGGEAATKIATATVKSMTTGSKDFQKALQNTVKSMARLK